MNKLTQSELRMQMLAGVITESEYAAAINQEVENTEKDSLNEHYVAGGIVGIGAINQIPSRAKADYEDAFEHFLGERYQIKPNRERDDIEDLEEDKDPDVYEVELEEERRLMGKEPIPFKEWESAIYDFITDNLTDDDEEIPMVVDVLEKLVKALRNQ
jgi:hypothetical protein